MKKIGTLIRLHKLELDEKRRRLRGLEEELAALKAARKNLDIELKNEQKTAGSDVSYSVTYAGYAKRFMQRREELEAALEVKAVEVDVAAEFVREAFQELKKYEITAGRQKAKAKKERETIEQNELDEAAGDKHQRKKKG
ncbi:MAG: flagellar FliJ family protein [Dongiaceae bacterium]